MFPASVYKIVNLALFPIITNLVLKVKMERCLVLQLIDYIAIFLIELLLAQNLSKVFGIDSYFEGMYIPAYRLIMVGIILIVEYIVYRTMKLKNVVINFPNELTIKQKATIIISCIIGLLLITGKGIEVARYNYNFHYIMFVIDTIFIVLTFVLSMKHIMNHGLGLWEVQKIINKNDNLKLATSIEGEFFKQQLNIYECA